MIGPRFEFEVSTRALMAANATDNLGDNSFILRPMFSILPRANGVEYFGSLSSPATVALNQIRIEDYLNSRARIVLFGHKHVQRVGPDQKLEIKKFFGYTPARSITTSGDTRSTQIQLRLRYANPNRCRSRSSR